MGFHLKFAEEESPVRDARKPLDWWGIIIGGGALLFVFSPLWLPYIQGLF